jgi:hypothetical protein
MKADTRAHLLRFSLVMLGLAAFISGLIWCPLVVAYAVGVLSVSVFIFSVWVYTA